MSQHKFFSINQVQVSDRIKQVYDSDEYQEYQNARMETAYEGEFVHVGFDRISDLESSDGIFTSSDGLKEKPVIHRAGCSWKRALFVQI